MDKMINLAVIPARSGSKGLKNKNIKPLCGKPMMAYSIEAALNSMVFDEVYVSTDSEEYAGIAREYGANVPFLRSEAASSDKAGSWDVVREAIWQYEKIGKNFHMVTLLQPTSPLRTSEDIKNAYRLYQEKRAKAIVSICEVDHSPLWSNTIPDDLSLEHFIRKEVAGLPRQELMPYYRINGGIYMVNVDYFKRTDNIYASEVYAYIMDKKNSVDVDDAFDFNIAEEILKMHS